MGLGGQGEQEHQAEEHDHGGPAERIILRLAGRRFDASVMTIAFALHPPAQSGLSSLVAGPPRSDRPMAPRGHCCHLRPYGFLDQFTVTVGAQGFAVEDGTTFEDRFSGLIGG